MKRFENKSAFVTGAGGYIGSTTAKMLAAEGAKVGVCDIMVHVAGGSGRFVTGQTWIVDGGRGLGMKGTDC